MLHLYQKQKSPDEALFTRNFYNFTLNIRKNL